MAEGTGSLQLTLNVIGDKIENLIIPHIIPTRERKWRKLLELAARTEDGNIQLGRENKRDAMRAIEDHCDPVKHFSFSELLDIASSLPKEKYPIGSLLILNLAFNKLKLCSDDGVLEFVNRLIIDVYTVTCSLLQEPKRPGLALTYGIDLLLETLRWLQCLTQNDEFTKIQAKCCAILSNIYNEGAWPDESIEYGEKGIMLFSKQFIGHPKSQKCYGFLLQNIGLAYHTKNDFRFAVDFYSAALQAFEKAVDFYDDGERRETIKSVRRARDYADRDNSTENSPPLSMVL